MAHAPALRVTAVNDAVIARRGDYVLYWMIAARRTTWSFALDQAIARAVELGRPLVVLEPLRAGYRWASDRHHAFVVQGMADNARAFAAAKVAYLPYVEPAAGDGAGLLAALARRACLIVTDEQPGFFLPRMVAAAGAALAVRVEQVDGNGVLPLRAADQAFSTAAAFRRHLQKTLPAHLLDAPAAAPLARLPRGVAHAEIPGAVLRRWKPATAAVLAGTPAALAAIAIDHGVAPVDYAGGGAAAGDALDDFVAHKLARYGAGHNHPDDDAASGLSPYLHFGHVSAHEIAARVWRAARWNPSRLAERPTGSRDGWWGLPAASEAFLDEVITWRELGYGFCFHRRDYDRYASLPAWARRSLDDHARDRRPVMYSRAALEAAHTADPVWNAAQRQLVAEGRIHNYLRMLWGKKILEWSRSPRTALATLIELNNKYAIDGRDPNSYSGIFWTLGRFDRPWAPIRPIFGCIRYMSSASTLKKLHLERYLARWSGDPSPGGPAQVPGPATATRRRRDPEA
ncbi:MAG TPA: deoxyribodipyrimidine photolyase [Kofleriaceae bacterium]|nr:deoxyribodipyrimidine photolyase [Kofleriaceae bacterium]